MDSRPKWSSVVYLLEAIEAGLVKVPQLPTQDITGARTPSYFNIWRWVEKLCQDEGHTGALTHELILRYAAQPILQLAGEWEKTFEVWKEHYNQGLRRHDVPPVFIIVCRDTALAKAVYNWLANGSSEFGAAPPLFKNQPGEEVTVRIDSKVAEDIEAGKGSNEEKRLRFVLDTVGKTEWPGGRVPEEYSFLVHKHNEKAADDENLQWIDEAIPPGRSVRCIISVAMLSEGWDATTVKHIVGLRPFGSQLLCEQSAAFVLDTHERVASWVKNDHLGFVIPYSKAGARKQYIADFIVRLTTGLMLILEVKGKVGDAELKNGWIPWTCMSVMKR